MVRWSLSDAFQRSTTVIAATAMLAGCGSEDTPSVDRDGHPRATPTTNMASFTPLERGLERTLRRDFACVVVPSEAGRDGTFLVYVTREAARVRARAVIDRLASTPTVQIRLADPLEDVVARRHLLAQLRRSRPEDVSVNLQSPVRDRCPKIALLVPTKGPHKETGEAWATAAQRRFGTSRVVIEHGDLAFG